MVGAVENSDDLTVEQRHVVVRVFRDVEARADKRALARRSGASTEEGVLSEEAGAEEHPVRELRGSHAVAVEHGHLDVVGRAAVAPAGLRGRERPLTDGSIATVVERPQVR